ncbi:ATP-grasp domain-containing protein [Ramlibacter sp. USB13]|uniref:ATP-grasp domain-containing protein n=1 Tax=Ramlibacter cellulosilyticus TaxID=2764187 RepID=A0A923S9Z2_9BURK|nr:ATP-grasp domain-containing protein [Ramlibacter cellulosilyticus]MBC5782231.1 ATP-grasp domain-containing protein [Ramlibacter cellulosilyticus]
MARVLVYEPLSADDPESTAALGRGSAAHQDMLAAGRAMRDAMAGDLARLPGVELTVAVGQQEARHRLHAVAALPGESAEAFVRRQARLHDGCWIVAPESGGLLLRLHAAVGARRWIGCSAAAIRLASSKRATCALLAKAGILTPLAFAEGHRGPWIVKPDDGAGSMATRVHATRAAADTDLHTRQHAVMEPWVEGEALSVSLVVGPVLARAVAFNRQHLDIDADGWLHDLGVQPGALPAADPRTGVLQAVARRVAGALPGLRGYVGIDLVWNGRDGPVVIEVNPRVTCAYVGLSALVGRNLAADILAAHGVQGAAGHVVA